MLVGEMLTEGLAIVLTPERTTPGGWLAFKSSLQIDGGQAAPTLRALLADDHPARALARNLFRLSRLLEVQGPTLIADGRTRVLRALGPWVGPYALQAAIAAVHAEASHAAQTDWAQTVGLYDRLLQVQPSPVVELNRAAAVALRDGPAAGLALIEALLARGELGRYLPAHATRAELWLRLGQSQQARVAFEQALALARTEPQQRFLRQQLADLSCRFGGPPFDQGEGKRPEHHPLNPRSR
jgi:tetratricopeptide (TPR) repeat protein